jgi:hypothetical protein
MKKIKTYVSCGLTQLKRIKDNPNLASMKEVKILKKRKIKRPL